MCRSTSRRGFGHSLSTATAPRSRTSKTTLRAEHHDCQPGFFYLLLQPIRNIVRYIRLPDVHEVLELIECQQAHTAALQQFPEANALGHRVAARP